MKQLFKHAIILCLILFNSACIDIVDPGELGLKDQLLVVNSIISPHQRMLSVQVSQSNSLFGLVPDDNTEKGLVKDAVVTLSDGTSTINLIYSAKDKLYMAKAMLLPIVPGSTYTLKVTAGKVTTTATSTVPGPGVVPVTDLKIDPRPNSGAYRVVLSWMDPEAQTNFYRVSTFLRGEKQNTTGQYTANNDIPAPGIIGNSVSYGGQEFHSDLTGNGSSMSARGKLHYSGKVSDEYNFLVGQLISCDENYYLYHRNRQNPDDENPFAERTMTHTNIKGGTGIFASYVKSPEFVLKLK